MAAVDAARAALLDDVDAADVGEHLGAVVDGERIVTHQFACTRRRVPRLALVGDRGPGDPAEGRDGLRGRADPRRRGDRRAGVGARTASASSPATSRPATCCPWPTRTRAWSRRTPSATTRSTPTRRPRSARSPPTSASAASARSPWRAATSPPSAGTTAPAAPSPRSPRRPRTPAAAAASWSAWPARWPTPSASAPTATPTTTAGSVTLRPRLRRPLRGTAGPQARAPAPPRAGARHPHRRRVRQLLAGLRQAPLTPVRVVASRSTAAGFPGQPG